jgi:hypothetical protein
LKAFPPPPKGGGVSLIINNISVATRIQNNSSTAIDNMFVANSRINLSSVSHTINDLSDHGAQILTIKNIYATLSTFPFKQRTRLISRETVMNLQAQNKTWESVCKDNDSNHIFNSFLCTFSNIFQNSFLLNTEVLKNKTGLHRV